MRRKPPEFLMLSVEEATRTFVADAVDEDVALTSPAEMHGEVTTPLDVAAA